MISLLVMIAVVGLIAYVIMTLIPMPPANADSDHRGRGADRDRARGSRVRPRHWLACDPKPVSPLGG